MLRLKVTNYETEYGRVGANFTCLYNRRFPWEVVHSINTVGDASVRHMVAWPAVVALICMICFIVTALICGCEYHVSSLSIQISTRSGRLQYVAIFYANSHGGDIILMVPDRVPAGSPRQCPVTSEFN